MAFTAFTGAVSHMLIDGFPDLTALLFCVQATFIGARVAVFFANKSEPKVLNRVTGIVLTILGLAMILVKGF